MDRIVEIATTVGFGETLIEVESNKNETIIALTDTGVIIVKSADRKRLVTMYLATYQQADAFYHRANQVFPIYMKNIIKKNMKRFAKMY